MTWLYSSKLILDDYVGCKQLRFDYSGSYAPAMITGSSHRSIQPGCDTWHYDMWAFCLVISGY